MFVDRVVEKIVEVPVDRIIEKFVEVSLRHYLFCCCLVKEVVFCPSPLSIQKILKRAQCPQMALVESMVLRASALGIRV